MSTLGERKGNGNPIEIILQPEETKAQIDGILRNFDVLPSRFDRFIFKYSSVYLIGLLFPCELFFILWAEALAANSNLRGGLNTVYFLPVLGVVALLSIIWPFKGWRLSNPKTLRNLYEKKCISLPNGDANTSYLRSLEHYRDALGSPKRYFLSGFLLIIFNIFGAYSSVEFYSAHPNSVVTILGTVTFLFFALEFNWGLYCFGMVIWAVYTSGWYVRKLVRAFEFRIQPFHPDQCGGLKLLGTFCFGFVSPLLFGSGFYIGYILFSLSVSGTDVISLVIKVGFPLFYLLFLLPVIVLAFILPVWDIHIKMVRAGETNEDTYAARIEALREEIQSLLTTNQVEEAKAVQEKKALVESLYTPYPTWPFRVRSKIFATVLGVSGSLLIGLLTAAFQQYFLPAILPLLFHKP
jgi:hypothetical protein